MSAKYCFKQKPIYEGKEYSKKGEILIIKDMKRKLEMAQHDKLKMVALQ